MVTFSRRLKQAMDELHLNQKQMSCMTGCSKAAVSQYLSGAHEPDEPRKVQMALALDLASDYFTRPDQPRQVPAGCKVNRMSVSEAARLMHVKKETITLGLQQGVFPWGYAIKATDRTENAGSRRDEYIYWINADRFYATECIS